MDLKQKQKIMKQFYLSPRCVKKSKTRPYQQFYSWKNFLNSDVDYIYKKLMQNKLNQSEQSQKIRQFKTSSKIKNNQPISQRKYQRRCIIQHFSNSSRQNRNCYSKIQMQVNTPIKNKKYQKHRHCSSNLEGEKFVQREDNSTKIPSENDMIQKVYQNNRGKFNSQFNEDCTTGQQVSNEKHSNQSNLSNQQYYNFQLQAEKTQGSQILMKKNKNFLIKKQNKQSQCNMNQLDLYHLQLKQQQRQYLLKKFMEHYQNIHHKKL